MSRKQVVTFIDFYVGVGDQFDDDRRRVVLVEEIEIDERRTPSRSLTDIAPPAITFSKDVE